MLKKIGEPSFKFIKYITLLWFIIYIISPLPWLFTNAFAVRGANYVKIPEEITLDNFYRIFRGMSPRSEVGLMHGERVHKWIMNSLILALVAMGVVLLLGSPAGYALSRLRFRGKDLLMTAILLIGFMPMTAKMLPLYKICLDMGIVNNLVGTGIVIGSGALPFQIWLLKAFFDYIPDELEEQAELFGCNRLETLFRVVLPSSGVGLMASAFLTFLSGWGNFTTSLILLRSERVYTLPLGIVSVATEIYGGGESSINIDLAYLSALGIVFIIPPLLVYLLFRRALIGIKLGRIAMRY